MIARDTVLGIIHYQDSANVARLIEDCKSWTIAPDAIVVVDNSSDLPAGCASTVINPNQNLGYGQAANLLIKWACEHGYRRLLLMTQDARLQPNAFELLHSFSTETGATVTGPQLRFRSKDSTVFSLGGILRSNGSTAHKGYGMVADEVNGESAVAVSWLDGACLLIDLESQAAIEGFDPFFFLYVEEVEFQLRARQSGGLVLMVPEAVGYQEPGNYSAYYGLRNSIYLTRKYQDIFTRYPILRRIGLEFLRSAKRRQPTRVLWAIRGALDGYREIGGKQPENIFALAGTRS